MRSELVTRLAELGTLTAVVDRGASHTYTDLAAGVEHVGETLREHQVRPHDVVVLNADFSFLSIATLLALYINRNVVIPVVTLNEATHTTIMESCGPTHTIRVDGDLTIEEVAGASGAGAGTYDRLVEAGAAGLVLLSSGSTGAPKAILHNLDSIVEEKLGAHTRVGRKPPNILMFLLFDHIGGINSLLGALRVGGAAIVPSQRTPDEICALIEQYGIRLLPTSPTFLNLLMIGDYHRKYDLTSLRLITYGTEPMPEELLKRVNAAFPRVKLLQTFGTSETGISTTTSESSSSTYFKIADENVQYRIVDGELQLKSNTQFMGYLNYPSDSLTEDSWFRTGDLVEEKADGYIQIRGRAKEIINVGGEKVLPLELESILIASPLIEDCVVYGKANSITGQSVCVDIKPTTDMTRPEARKHVTEFLTGKVDQFKIPAKVNIVDAVTVSERFKKRRSQP
ncbi:ANL family adenylate-forming protein [Salinactinospora qingdaonensis]|uniref:Fatty acid--CoA ligase family protein n=1 Tax=Salinactinospora qingdaonensis TaxID=702744 RepID=A0ABP7G4S2_9ACTN